jgi:L-fuconolactonase
MRESFHRRDFLKHAALMTFAGKSVITRRPIAAANERTREAMAEPAKIPIIDTHQHLWDLSKFRLPWQKQGSPLAKSFLMADYLKAAEGLGITKAVYMEVDLAPEQQQAEAGHIIDICKRGDSPTVAAVISGRPESDNFKKYVAPFRDSPYIKGVRRVLHNVDLPAGLCLRDTFVRNISLLGELGLCFDICLRHGELLDGAKLIDQCPQTRFILDHCGNPDVQAKDNSQWKRDIAEVAKRKNVVVKISGILASAKPGNWTPEELAPTVNHTMDVFGPDRVMFGGDWPVCTLAGTLKQWTKAVQTIVRDRKESEQRKLFYDNAEKFYGLQ